MSDTLLSSALPPPSSALPSLLQFEQHSKKTQNLYALLGVKEDCTAEELKKKFIELSLLYHPDKNGGDKTRYMEIKCAYEILKTPENRAVYNQTTISFMNMKDKYEQTNYLKTDIYKNERGDFNLQSFLRDFDKKEATQFLNDKPMSQDIKQLLQTPLSKPKTIEEIMRERDQEINLIYTARNNPTSSFPPSSVFSSSSSSSLSHPSNTEKEKYLRNTEFNKNFNQAFEQHFGGDLRTLQVIDDDENELTQYYDIRKDIKTTASIDQKEEQERKQRVAQRQAQGLAPDPNDESDTDDELKDDDEEENEDDDDEDEEYL